MHRQALASAALKILFYEREWWGEQHKKIAVASCGKLWHCKRHKFCDYNDAGSEESTLKMHILDKFAFYF